MTPTAVRYAPSPLRFPVVRSAKAGIVVCASCAVAMAPMLAWSLWAWWQGDGVAAFGAGLLTIASAACSAWAIRQWRSTTPGHLAWDGTGWKWLDTRLAECPIGLEVVWDGQDALLLRSQPQGGLAGTPRWIWIDRHMASAHWGDLRRAVYFRGQSGDAPI